MGGKVTDSKKKCGQVGPEIAKSTPRKRPAVITLGQLEKSVKFAS